MSALFLSRARLKREPSVAALAPLLLPDASGERAQAAHRLVWSLFAGDATAERDFLFRELRPGGARRGGAEFMILSRRRPLPESPLFEVETQAFAPSLSSGDRLRFSLRANATVARKDDKGRAKRSDVVMHALHAIAEKDRHKERDAILSREGVRWLAAQGERSGFRLSGDDDDDDAAALRIDGYDLWRFPKLGRNGNIAVFDCEGVLEVTDPAAFIDRLARGFGRARGFGCGLMLIRRA